MSKLKVFISYAKVDRDYVYKLKRHLTGLIRNGFIEDWSDLGVLPGSETVTKTKAQLEEADIIIFLISPDFINSDYINDFEIKKTIERHYKGEAQIVPVIIRPCDFSSLSLDKFNILPKNKKAISTWENEDKAWSNILLGLKKVINGFDRDEWGNYINTAKKVEQINFPKHSVDNLLTEIDKDNIEYAIKELLTITKENNKKLFNQAIILWSRFKSYNSNWNDGLISDKQANITKNQIKKTLLSIINYPNEYVKSI